MPEDNQDIKSAVSSIDKFNKEEKIQVQPRPTPSNIKLLLIILLIYVSSYFFGFTKPIYYFFPEIQLLAFPFSMVFLLLTPLICLLGLLGVIEGIKEKSYKLLLISVLAFLISLPGLVFLIYGFVAILALTLGGNKSL